MGRPLNKKYFGNRNIGSASVTTDNGIGGQGVASVTIAGEFSGFTDATTTVTFSAPELPTGITATGTATIVAGEVTAIVITEQGSGYTSAPTVTIADSDVGAEVTTGTATAVLTVDTGNIRSSTNQENAILMTARLVGGSAVTVDIIKQVSTDRFKVTDGTRTGIVKLKSSVATAEGEASIRLLDSDSGTYFATKITSRKVKITRGTGVQAAFVTNTAVQWNMTAATATSLLIDNA